MRTGREDDTPETIEDYLRALDDALRGPREWKRRVLTEIEDGLLCELAAEHQSTEHEVVRGWGRIDEVAEEFNIASRAIRARRLARNILQWTPILVIGWALVVRLSPDPWPTEPTLIWWVAPVLFASAIAAVVGAVQVAWRSVGSVLVRGVVCACTGVVVGVLCLAVLLFYRLVSSHWHIFWPGTITTGALTLMLLVVVAFHAWHLFRPAVRTTNPHLRD